VWEKGGTYRDDNLGGRSTLGDLDALAVGAALVDLLEVDASIAVLDSVSEDCVAQLCNEVEVRRVTVDGKGEVARTTARGDLQVSGWGDGEITLADIVSADEVGAQVGNKDEPAGRVKGGLVRMGSLLPVGVGAGLLQLEDELIDLDEGSRVGGIPRGEGRSATT
jgi:hypothetical protein